MRGRILRVAAAAVMAGCSGSQGTTPAPAPTGPALNLPPTATASAGAAQPAPVSLRDAPPGGFWSHVGSSKAFEMGGSQPTVVGTAFCTRRAKPARVHCVDSATGRSVRSEQALPATRGMLVSDGSSLTEVTSNGNTVSLRDLSGTAPGPVRTVKINNYGYTDGTFALPPKNGRTLIGATRKQTRSEYAGAKIFAVDMKSGSATLVMTFAVDARLAALTDSRAYFVAYKGGWGKPRTASLHALDRATGKQVWSYIGRKRTYLRPPVEHKNVVTLIDNEARMLQLDAASGKVLRKVVLPHHPRHGSSASVQPIADGDHLYLVTDRVVRVDATTGKVLAKQASSSYARQLLVLSDVVVAARDDQLQILDKATLATQRVLRTSESWEFGKLAPAARGFGVLTTYRRNNRFYGRVDSYRPVASGTIEFSALGADVTAYRQGRRLGAGRVELAQGSHRLDLMRPGFAPVSKRVDVRGGQTVRLTAADGPSRRASDLKPDRYWAVSPRPVSVFADPAARRVLFALKLKGSTAADAEVAASVSFRDGLVAIDQRSGAVKWSVAAAQLQAVMLSKATGYAAPHPPKIEMVTVDSASRQVIVVTDGWVPNRFAAFDRDSGKLNWAAEAYVVLPHMSTRPGAYYRDGYRIAHGMLWHRDDRQLFGRDLRSGRLVFEHYRDPTESIDGLPVFHGDRVYLLAGGQLRAMELFTQRELWAKKVPRATEIFLEPDQTGLIVVTEKHVVRYGFDGKQRAKSAYLAGNLDDNAPLFTNDYVYVCGHFRNKVYALRRKNLALAWTFSEKRQSPCPSAIGPGDELLLTDGRLAIVVAASTGKEKRRFQKATSLQLWKSRSSPTEVCLTGYDRLSCY